VGTATVSAAFWPFSNYMKTCPLAIREVIPVSVLGRSAIQLNSIRVHLTIEGSWLRSDSFEGITYALMLGLADHMHTMSCLQNICAQFKFCRL
jgi:hypothetical protein